LPRTSTHSHIDVYPSYHNDPFQVILLVTGIAGGYLLSSLTPSNVPGAGSTTIPPIFLPMDLLRVWLLSVTLAIAAGIFPVWKASKLSPMVALRRE
jgi:putative ABC transport system permease protein